jgi:hypothetical protein
MSLPQPSTVSEHQLDWSPHVTIAAFRSSAASRLCRVASNNVPDRSRRLPLRIELFLVAHDDETGRPHIDRDTLARGLAVAILLDLWLEGRVHIGWRFDARTGRGTPEPGLIRVVDRRPLGDPLADSVLATLWRTGGGVRIDDFITQLAATGLYDRVQADMIASGILRRTTRRRFWFFTTDVCRTAHTAYPVRVRFRLRQLAGRPRPGVTEPALDPRPVALAGLVTALGLTRYLYPPDTTLSHLYERLRGHVEDQTDPTIRDVTTAIGRRSGF